MLINIESPETETKQMPFVSVLKKPATTSEVDWADYLRKAVPYIAPIEKRDGD